MMPVAHKEVSGWHLLCIAGTIGYCSENWILKLGGIIVESIFEQSDGTWFEYLEEIDDTAREVIDTFIEDMIAE